MAEVSSLLLAVSVTALLFGCFWLFGHGLIRLCRLDLEGSDVHQVYAVAAGTAIFSVMLFVLCLVHAYNWPGLVLGLSILIALSLVILKGRLAANWQILANGFQKRTVLFALFFLVLTAPGLLLAGLPPFFKDSLIYHLYIPKLMIAQGTFVDIPGLSNSNFPLGMDLIYGVGLMVRLPEVARLLHYGFFLMLLYVTYRVGNRFGRYGGLVAAMITALTPSIQIVATWAYIDIALCFLTLAILVAICDQRINRTIGGAVFLGVLLGFSLWMKYLSLYLAAYAAVLMFAAHARQQFRLVDSFKNIFAALAVAGIFACPWYVKNIIQTGNPVFPYFSNIFGGAQQWDPFFDKAYFHLLSNYGHGEGIAKYLLSPWYLVRYARFETIAFDGVIGWVYLPVFVLVVAGAVGFFRRQAIVQVMTLAVLFGYVLWMTNSQQLRFLLPTLCLVPLLGVAALYNLIRKEKVRIVLLAVLAVLSLGGLKEIGSYFNNTRPLPYLTGQESRQDVLTRLDPLQKTYTFINENLDRDAYLFLVLVGNKRFYLDRRAYSDSIFEYYSLQKALRTEKDAEGLHRWIQQMGFTHILFDVHYIVKPFTDEELGIFRSFLASYGRKLFEDGYFVLVEIL